jgi:hypothetical protein
LSSAYAATISYTFSGTGAGSFAGTPFSNEAFSMVLTGDTSAVTGIAPDYTLIATSTSIYVAGFGAAISTDPYEVDTGLFAGFGEAYFLDASSPSTGGLFMSLVPGLLGYNLTYSIGPFLAQEATIPYQIPTTEGTVVISSFSGGTFAASVAPEPATWVQLCGALLGMILLPLRRPQTR